MAGEARGGAGAPVGSAASESHTAGWFFENCDDLFGVVDPAGRILMVNPAWEAVAGWSREDLIGRPLLELVHADCHEQIREMHRAAGLNGAVKSTLRLAHKNGGWVWLEGYSRHGPDGEIMGMLRDVTADRQRAEELEHTRAGHARLGETAGVGAWRFDPGTGELEYSPEWLAMLAAEGIVLRVSEDFMTVCHPDDQQRVVETIGKVIRNGGTEPLDHRVRSASGRWLHIRAHIWLETRLDGSLIVHGISQNVTELTEALQAAAAASAESQAHSQRLGIALQAARGAVIEIDFAAGRVWTSPEFEALVGRTMTFEEAIQPVWPFVHPDDADLAAARVQAWRDGATPEPLDIRIQRPGGASMWARFYAQIDRDPAGGWRRVVALLMDVDEPKRQELALIEAEHAAQLAAEAKSQFLANMSHEIRTPMNGVLGVLHLLKARPNTEAAAVALIDEALACGGMLQALLDDVVDFSKIEAGRLELARDPADPASIVEGVTRLLRPQAEDKGLALKVEMEGLPAWVLTDATRLRQCLFNLVGNAVKFTAEGSVTVRAAASPDGQRLRFEVEDTGIGISEDAQAKLFQRFQQADASTTRRFGGSGLGLAITRKLVELMDGQAGVRSEPDRGSTFWFEIAAPPAEAPQLLGAAGAAMLEGLHILVVEDNATNRMIATKMLEGLGAQVETAEDGELGVAAARRHGFDLILMDIQMPGIDGMEATRQIRALDGPAAGTPILALTANVLRHQRDIYLAAGMDGVIGKPISPAALLTEIARLAGGSVDEAVAASA
jgi:PAS domain S-box-containing protein